MVNYFLKYIINKLRFPDLPFKIATSLNGEIQYKKQCSIGRGCRITNLILDQNVKIGNKVYLENVELGRNVRIYDGCGLFNVDMAKYSYVSQNSIISHARIGSFCSIGRNIHCTGANHPTDYLSTHPVFYSTRMQCGVSFANNDMFDEFIQIEIGNDVWIGSNSIILGGVKINNGAIIGAGSVVTKDVSPYSIVVGNPAKHIRFRFDEETLKQIQKMEWWNWDESKILKEINKFQSPFLFTR